MTERTILMDAFIRVLTLLVTVALLPAIKRFIELHKDNKELQLVLMLAGVAVKSVENDLSTEAGQTKKAEAIKQLAEALESWGLKDFTAAELDHYIETAVRGMWAEEPGTLTLT